MPNLRILQLLYFNQYIIKELVKMERLIESYDEFKNSQKLNEKLIKAPDGGFKRKDIEKILKKEKDCSLYIDSLNKTYFITPYMHDSGKLEGANEETLKAADKSGKKYDIKYKDISSITV